MLIGINNFTERKIMNKDDIRLKKQENDYLKDIFYNGSSKKGTY